MTKLKLMLILGITIFIVTVLTGCNEGTFYTESYTTFSNPLAQNISYAEQQGTEYNLIIIRKDDSLAFSIIKDNDTKYTLEALECILKDNNTGIIYANYGNYINMIYKDLEIDKNSSYTFGAYYDDMDIVYEFNINYLKEHNIVSPKIIKHNNNNNK
jgi:hypothetical protein